MLMETDFDSQLISIYLKTLRSISTSCLDNVGDYNSMIPKEELINAMAQLWYLSMADFTNEIKRIEAQNESYHKAVADVERKIKNNTYNAQTMDFNSDDAPYAPYAQFEYVLADALCDILKVIEQLPKTELNKIHNKKGAKYPRKQVLSLLYQFEYLMSKCLRSNMVTNVWENREAQHKEWCYCCCKNYLGSAIRKNKMTIRVNPQVQTTETETYG